MPWIALAAILLAPLIAAGQSPLLQWRQPIYIAAGFAGIAAFALMLAQPLLATHHMPGLTPLQSRRAHRATGAALTAAVILHIAGLWITSPPDVIDVLLFRSPTPFAPFGAVALWAILAAAALPLLRRKIRPKHWRRAHLSAVTLALLCTIAHMALIEGTMATWTKWLLAFATLTAFGLAVRPRPSLLQKYLGGSEAGGRAP